MGKDFFDYIGKTQNNIKNQLKNLGSVEKTIDKFFEGNFILDCPKCKTHNLCEVENFDEIILELKDNEINFDKYGKEFELFYCNKCEDYAVLYKK